MPVIYLLLQVTLQLKHSTLVVLTLGRATLKQRFTWTCSSWTAQPDDHPPAGSLLHHLLTLTTHYCMAVIFFYLHLLSPIASIFGSRMPYAAPDFPLASITDASDRAGTLPYQSAKIVEIMEKAKYFNDYLYLLQRMALSEFIIRISLSSLFLVSFCMHKHWYTWDKRN